MLMSSGSMMTALSRVAVTALACAAVGVLAYRTGRANGEAAVTAEWSRERVEIARATLKGMERRIEAETKMTETMHEQSRTYQRRLAAVAADRDRLLDSLRERPARADRTDVPGAATAGAGPAACTGAELYRDDAAFLVRLAADADELRAAVERCQAAYDAMRSAVNGSH